MLFIKKHKLLILLTIIGAFLRFYNLNWGSPFYFHPDERNIASSVSQLRFPDQMNPHFFAYGSFPIYIIYFLGIIWNLFLVPRSPDELGEVGFESAIIISRLISAILSTLLISLLYLIGKTLKDKTVGFLSTALGTFSIGFIQFAHFGTFEVWTTFLSVLLFYVCLKLLKESSFWKILLAGVICGLLVATKISNFPLLLIPLLTLAIYCRYTNISVVKKIIPRIFFLLVVSFLIFFITSPFVFSDFSSFLSSINYESEVALGILPVFYTGEFFNTISVIFQFLKIYPFILNPFLTIIFIPSFFYLSYTAIKLKSFPYYILNTIYLILFILNAFLFAKWTRYIIPTLPFMYLISSIFLIDFLKIIRNQSYYKYISIFILIGITLIYTFSYFITAFVKSDTRAEAALWAKNNLTSNANILSEVYDLGIVPFNQYFSNIKLFNFYDLDSNFTKLEKLNQILDNTDYIILPSQRLMKTRLINGKQSPVGYSFYKSLFEERLGFKKIYETPCDIFCKITYLGNTVFSFEQTANVFDRPTVFIFKKI